MIIKATNACQSTGTGACGVLEGRFLFILYICFLSKYCETFSKEAKEWQGEGLSSEEFNEETNGSCHVYRECCIEGCHPDELGPEEC